MEQTFGSNPKIIWAELPLAEDDEPCTAQLYDGDDYIVRLASGEVLWARWSSRRGAHFVRIDEGGEGGGEMAGDGIASVREVMISGYSPENIAAVFGRAQSLTDRVIATVLARIPVAMARAKQLTEKHSERAAQVAS